MLSAGRRGLASSGKILSGPSAAQGRVWSCLAAFPIPCTGCCTGAFGNVILVLLWEVGHLVADETHVVVTGNGLPGVKDT